MAKRREKLLDEFEKGGFRVAVMAQMIGDRIIKVIVYIWRGAKLVFKHAYPTLKRATVAIDNWMERAIRSTTGARVDVPIVKG